MQMTLQEEVRDKANLGVEVELRNITIFRGDRDWDEEAELEELTDGGPAGVFVSDHHQGKSAIIEWASGHPPFSTLHKGKDLQTQVDELMKVLKNNNRGKLKDFVTNIKPFMDVGAIKPDQNEVKYKGNLAGAPTQTQINLEVPFENIGIIPELTDKDKDAANLFSGKSSEKAREVFIKSREAANIIADKMLDKYNDNHLLRMYDKDKSSIASLLTIFFHTQVNSLTTGGKDAQGVLFKTGAGDLARLALNIGGKLILWYCIHRRNEWYINELGKQGLAIYKAVYGDRGGVNRATKVKEKIIKQAKKSFRVLKDDDEMKKDLRWEDEATNKRYTDNVNQDWYEQGSEYKPWDEVDENQDYEFVDTKSLSGVKTGKFFDVAEHTDNSNNVKAKYLIAEIRRNDNELNELVKGKGITDKRRKKLAEKVKALQTPMKLSSV